MSMKLMARRLFMWGLAVLVYFSNSLASAQAVSGEYIIKFKAQVTAISGSSGKISGKGLATANRFASDKGLKILSALKGINVRHKFENAAMMHLDSVTSGKLAFLKSHPDVEFIEPNYILSLDPTVKGQDLGQSSKPKGASPDSTDRYSQSFAAVQVDESWALEKAPASATKTVVAVVDTGLDINHAVFNDSNAVWTNDVEANGITGVDDDGNGFVDDIHGWNFVDNSSTMYDDADHGTHVSGIILGAGQDIMQDPVRESKVMIMPLKFLDGSGSGTTANAVNAIYYAVNNGARVINNSWGGSTYSRSLHDAYKYAYDHNVVLVTAAGNSNLNLDQTPMYPAVLDAPSNITVGSSTNSDRRSSFSNHSTSLVHIFAPGSSIMSTIPGSQCTDAANLFYYCLTSLSGTSMAAPFVAGLAALAIREAPHLSAYQIKGVILSATDSSSYLTNYTQTGGRVNALKVIQIAQAQIAAAAWLPEYEPVYKTDASSQASSGGGGGAGGCGLVKAVHSGMENEMQDPPSGGQMGQALLISIIMLAPALAAISFRKKKIVRKYERFEIAKEIMIQIGDQVVSSASQTLAVGGLSFKSDLLQLQKGQKIKVKISEVSDEIEGEIVWSSAQNSFGVKFLNATEELKNQMHVWSLGLTPAR